MRNSDTCSRTGLVKDIAHHTNRNLDAIPVAAKLRRLPLALRELASTEIWRLEQEGIIEKVDASEWGYPVWRLSEIGMALRGSA